MRFLLVLASLALAVTAEAKVSLIECSTMGTPFLNARVSLTRDQWDTSADYGYDLELRSRPRGRETEVEIKITSGGMTSYATTKRIALSEKPRQIVRDFVEDFLLECRTR